MCVCVAKWTIKIFGDKEHVFVNSSVLYSARASSVTVSWWCVCVCVWVGGGGGVCGGLLPIYGIVRVCVPHDSLFSALPGYDWPPFFNKKYTNDPIFLDSYTKGPFFLTSWYMHICFAKRFFEAAYSLGIT